MKKNQGSVNIDMDIKNINFEDMLVSNAKSHQFNNCWGSNVFKNDMLDRESIDWSIVFKGQQQEYIQEGIKLNLEVMDDHCKYKT